MKNFYMYMCLYLSLAFSIILSFFILYCIGIMMFNIINDFTPDWILMQLELKIFIGIFSEIQQLSPGELSELESFQLVNSYQIAEVYQLHNVYGEIFSLRECELIVKYIVKNNLIIPELKLLFSMKS